MTEPKVVNLKPGAVFWVLWASFEVTRRDPKTHAYNLFFAFENFYPMAVDEEYDLHYIRAEILPGLNQMVVEEEDDAARYFLDRVCRMIK